MISKQISFKPAMPPKNNITKDEALRIAIEALETNIIECRDLTSLTDALIACKEALEQPLTRDWKETIDERIARDDEFKAALEIQEQKPMTTTDVITCSMYGKCCMTGETIYTHHAPSQEQEPVAWTKQSELERVTTLRFPMAMWKNKYASIENNIPLYTHPIQPLSDDEIEKIFDSLPNEAVGQSFIHTFARAIEAAHGIGE